jgi:hypothetical protein
MLLQLAKRGSVPVRASYTPLTRLLHASYTPLARLSSVLAHAPPASEAWQCASSRSVGTASVFVLLYSIYLALLPRAGAEWLCASSRVFVLFSICTFVLNLLGFTTSSWSRVAVCQFASICTIQYLYFCTQFTCFTTSSWSRVAVCQFATHGYLSFAVCRASKFFNSTWGMRP